jgi:Tol biopolymer transport system component/DNA-binding winged helix-turn-helix (wHTH) protein
MNQPAKRCYSFGEHFLDVSERLLLRNGQCIPLAPKVFDTLVLLVENAGHLVEKDEFMARLWPGTFVGEDALARNISILRKVLGGTSDSQALIVTVPTRGYRFEAAVRETNDERKSALVIPAEVTKSAQAIAEPSRTIIPAMAPPAAASDMPAGERTGLSGIVARRSWRSLITFAIFTLALGAFAGLVTFAFLAPARMPRVIRMEKLTYSGNVDPWPRLVTDGVRVYYLARQGDHWDLMQTSVNGGESQIITTPFKNAAVLDVSPDRANLLLASFEEREQRMPLWIWPVQGGALRRVGDITAFQAVWHPDGTRIVYTEDDGMYIADSDGTNARKFIATDGQPSLPSWSPDGRTLHFTTASANWQVGPDGKVLSREPYKSGEITDEFNGVWSASGKYFLFEYAGASIRNDVWAIREAADLFHRRPSPPVRLTNGPMSYEGMASSKDGSKIFVVGSNARGGVALYDEKSHQATSMLSGVCVTNLVFSPDGQWIACQSASLSILRMRPDGRELLTLASHPLGTFSFVWSPDGRQIAFVGTAKNGRAAIFVVPSDGGTPRHVFADNLNESHPSWSPDGKLLAFDRAQDDSSSHSIWTLDLKSGQLSLLPGSQGMFTPTWSPDGRFISSQTDDGRKIMLFNFQTRHWTQLAQGMSWSGAGSWSSDGKFLYVQDKLGKGMIVYRISMSSRKVEVAATFESLLNNGVQTVGLVGLAPDGSFVVLEDRGGSDIYALDLDLP